MRIPRLRVRWSWAVRWYFVCEDCAPFGTRFISTGFWTPGEAADAVRAHREYGDCGWRKRPAAEPTVFTLPGVRPMEQCS